MKIYENHIYQDNLKACAKAVRLWKLLKDKSMLLSGATGMIGSYLIDFIMLQNKEHNLNCKIYALGRNEEKAKDRFGYCYDSEFFVFIQCDINGPITSGELLKDGKIDYIIHLASNTHPLAYATDPIGTITTNIIGTQNMLELAVEHRAERFVFASSVEIYGENRGDVEKFDESYMGYIDCNTLRAGYPESKRCGEALCQAYMKQKGVDVVIPRFSRVYGPTMLESDTKAASQFILKAVGSEDIVLKSAGTQFYSYTYVADAVSGLLTVMLKGKSGEAYNIADKKSDIMLKDFAKLCAAVVGTKVVFEIPDVNEIAGYSKATKAILDGKRIEDLGWVAKTEIKNGIRITVMAMKGI